MTTTTVCCQHAWSVGCVSWSGIRTPLAVACRVKWTRGGQGEMWRRQFDVESCTVWSVYRNISLPYFLLHCIKSLLNKGDWGEVVRPRPYRLHFRFHFLLFDFWGREHLVLNFLLLEYYPNPFNQQMKEFILISYFLLREILIHHAENGWGWKVVWSGGSVGSACG